MDIGFFYEIQVASPLKRRERECQWKRLLRTATERSKKRRDVYEIK
jgi:hypothetical protein